MTGLGTPRYTSPEVLFHQPYNLKADVYSFCVVLWEIMCLKKPFAKYNQRKELERAFSRLDSKPLSINRRWPQPIQDIFRSGLSRDLWARPVMSDICKVLTECTSTARDLQKFWSSFSSASTSSIQEQKHYMRRRHSSESSGTTVDTRDNIISSEDWRISLLCVKIDGYQSQRIPRSR